MQFFFFIIAVESFKKSAILGNRSTGIYPMNFILTKLNTLFIFFVQIFPLEKPPEKLLALHIYYKYLPK